MSTRSELIEALSQGWPVTGEESTADLAEELEAIHETPEAAAAVLRVSVAQFRKWLAGTAKARGADRARLEAALRFARLPKGIEDATEIEGKFIDHHGKVVKVVLSTLDKFDVNGKVETPAKYKPGAIQPVVDAYVAGNYEAMEDAYVAGIADEWYRDAAAEGVANERALRAGLPGAPNLPDNWRREALK